MTPQSKKAFLEALLENAEKPAFILCDPRKPGVQVPAEHKTKAKMVLKVPCARLQVTWAGVSCTPTFGSLTPEADGSTATPYVFLPWHCIVWIGRDFGTKAAMGHTWPEDAPDDWMPPDVDARREAAARARAAARVLGWRVLDGGGNGASSGPNTTGVS